MPKPIIEFQMYRDFGNIIGDSFKFWLQNIKTFALGFLMYVIPFFLIGTAISWFIIQTFGGLESFGVYSYSIGNLVFILGSILSAILMYAMVFAMVDIYRENNGEVSVGDLWPRMTQYLGTIIIFILIYIAGLAVLGALGFLSYTVSPILGGLVAFAMIFGLIYLLIRYLFVMYISINEKLSISDSFNKSAMLIENHWWWTFLTVIVLSIIAGMLSYVVGVPVAIYTWSKTFLDIGSGNFAQGPSISVIIATGISTIASIFTQIYFIVGVIFHYYALKERKEGTSLMDKIQQIGNMNSSQFENEGDF